MAGGHPKLRMTDDELSAFLDEERVLTIATIDEDGWPALVPVWFTWHDGSFWFYNLTKAKRTTRLMEPGATKMAVSVDGGHEYAELRGVHARVEHRHVPDEDVPTEVLAKHGARYFGMDGDTPMGFVDDHQWFELRPIITRTWDFRKVYG